MREIAKKVQISELKGEFHKSGNINESSYLNSINGRRLARVNILGTIIKKFDSQEKQFTSLLIDDFTGRIKINTFEEEIKILKKFKQGNVVSVIGKIKENNDSLFILCEGIKKINTQEELFKRIENIYSMQQIKEIKQETDENISNFVSANELKTNELNIERKIIE